MADFFFISRKDLRHIGKLIRKCSANSIFIYLKISFKHQHVKKIVFFFVTSCGVFSLSAQNAADSFTVYEQSIPGSSLHFKMVPIQGGQFLMGSSDNDKSRKPDEVPQKNIGVSPFWMDAYEVSRDEFDVFYKDENTPQNTVDAITRPSQQYIDFSLGMGKEGGFPVNSLSQYSALMYCRWLYKKTGIFYRLPTEVEWEYACRAGSHTIYYFGDDSGQLKNYAWYIANSDNKFQKSGLKLPNAWGLYDMLGNLSEWTLDHYDEKALGKITDKTTDPPPAFSTVRYPKVLKGGGYGDEAVALRIANRMKSDPLWNRRDPQIPKSKWWLTEAASVGFRIIRPLKQPTKEEAETFFKKYLGQ
jgi:formylglycine-generating enzyme required for sulfatase activity